MKYREFGADQQQTIVLLHGGGLSWWNYREAAEMLRKDYHVVLPILDGHAGSDRPFTSIEDNAAEILSFLDKHYAGSVLLIGGLSLGGQILLEMLSQRKDICSFALVESAMVIPSKLTNAMIGPAFSGSYNLIKNRSFSKLQFRSLHMKPELFEDYYRDTCLITRQDLIAFMKANTSYELKDTFSRTSAEVHVFAGAKENRGIRRSAELIAGSLPSCEPQYLPGCYHGEFSINHPDQYAAAVRQICSRKTESF